MTYKILIVGPAWVGDMVMAQGLFRLIKQNHSDAVIDVLAPAWTFSLLSRMPEVNRAIEMPIAHGDLQLRLRYQLAKTLRAERYDQAIVLPNSWKSALIPWLARIPKRTGWVGECRYGLLNDARRLDKKRYPLMLEQFVALGLEENALLPSPLPVPLFAVPVQKPKTPILALCPGAEFGPAKRWPEDYFASLAKQKLAEGWRVWLLGSPKDQAIIDTIIQMTDGRCENYGGHVGLAEKIDLLAQVTGVVTNDSGLMHIAAALNKPLIAVYGATSPAFTPPLAQQAQILQTKLDCQPCFQRTCPLKHHRCMRELYPAQVLAGMAEWVV